MLGEGGMGQVYRARDARLNRDVAIKLLHAGDLGIPDRRARFAAEARAASALNHPNIITIYDVGEEDGKPYIVSECVEGETLRTIVRRGALSTRRLLEIGVQIAAGLAAAHGSGITHRDLKPENVMVTTGGRVKLVDFGLAKAASTPPVSIGHDDLTLPRVSETEAGTVMGTADYMSPEQARGEAVDYHSDQFSVGLILYELASGKQAFHRDSRAETMAAIIREEPRPLESSVPAPLRWITERLLAKESQDRYASTEDLYRDLRILRERLSEISTGNTTAPASPSRRGAWLRLVIPATIAVSLVTLAYALLPARRDPGEFRYTPVVRNAGAEVYPRWSPDGKSIVYSARFRDIDQVMVKEIDATSPAQLTHGARSASTPFWSPDGATIFFIQEQNLWSINASGGEPSLAIAGASDGAIHPDGRTFVFVRKGKLWTGTRDRATQKEWGPASALSSTASMGNRIDFSPDGSKAGLVVPAAKEGEQDLLLISWPSGKTRRVPLPSGDTMWTSWYPDSQHILLATRDNSQNFRLAEFNVTTGASRTIEVTPQFIMGQSLSPDGNRLAFSAGSIEWDIYEMSIPDGRVRLVLARGDINVSPDWSPSGTHFLFETRYRGYDELEDRPYPEGFPRVLVSSRSDGLSGAGIIRGRWAPDGDRIVLSGNADVGQKSRIWLMNAAGGRPAPLDRADNVDLPGWSPDGQWIAYVRQEGARTQLVKLRPQAGTAPIPLSESSRAFTTQARTDWSPKGDWILFVGLKPGLTLITPEGQSQRSLSARTPSVYGFSKDGAHVYAVIHNTATSVPEWQLLSFDVATGAEKVIRTVDLPPSVSFIGDFSMHPDGKRFLFCAATFNPDIWMLEGFEQRPSLLDSFLRRY